MQALEFTLLSVAPPNIEGASTSTSTGGGTRGRRHARRQLQLLSIDRAELFQITEQHYLLQTFQAELGKEVVVAIQIVFTDRHVSILIKMEVVW